MLGEFPLVSNWIVNAALEKAIGVYVGRTDESREALRALAGKVIALNARPFPVIWYLIPTPDGMQVREEFSGAPDVTLSGPALAFARLGLGRDDGTDLFSGDIQVAGDRETARLLQRLLAGSRFQWETLLARFTDPAVAQRLSEWTAGLSDWGRTTGANLRQDVAEFFQEENRDVPSAPETDAFLSGVDRLREDCEQLEARIRRLQEARLASTTRPD